VSGALFIVVVFAAMWAVVILPQQRQLKRHRALVAALAVGDEVVTTSGIHGTVVELGDESLRLAVADGVELRVERQAIGRRAPAPSGDPVATDDVARPDESDRSTATGSPSRPLEA
jgi:preprotein translocase subunit YajC